MSGEREELRARVEAALRGMKNPRTGSDLLASDSVQGLEVDGEGKVRFQFLLRPDDAGSLVRDTRAAVELAKVRYRTSA